MHDVFVHERALCESSRVGPGTRIWAHAHVLPGAVIGAECNVCDGVFVENDVTIGSRVTIKCGVQLWDGITVEDDVFIGPNATFTNDPFPRSKLHPRTFAKTVVRRGASIGANATVLPGLEIGAHAMVGAGAVVTRSVPPNAIALGNPACIVGYVDTVNAKAEPIVRPATLPAGPHSCRVRGVTTHELPLVHDMRGDLSVGEFEQLVPFLPRRYFIVFDVPSREVRGEHAHLKCHQFLVCIRGSCHLVADDGQQRQEFVLDRPNFAVHLPPMTWGIQYKYSPDAVLLVFASDPYRSDDYIRNYDDFLTAAGSAASR